MPSIQIGSWQTLSAEGGGTIALDGDRTAVAGPAHLVVWSGAKRVCASDAPWPAHGAPRFLGDCVLWGPGALDLNSGEYKLLEETRPTTWPGGGEHPSVHAWSAQGDRMLVSYSTGDSARPTRVTLFEGNTGKAVATLWHGIELPPQAAWVGRQAAVVGFRDLRVFDASSGAERGTVALDAGTITRLDADTDERHLIAVDLNRSIMWIDPDSWLVIDCWKGRWQDAAIAPGGRYIAALDLSGRLHFACLADGRFHPIGDAAAGIRYPGSVALSEDSIGLVGDGVAARTMLVVECAGE
jgi:hypothetical protein